MKHPFIDFCRNAQIKSVQKQMKGQSLPTGLDIFEDVHYKHDDSPYHTLDIYYPSFTEALLPIVISIHGGAFIGGDKFFNKEFCMRLALHHYCVININYDLAPEAKLLDMVMCVNDALLWVYRNAEKYHGNKKCVFGLGDSAGGWQALTYTIVNKNEELRNKYSFLLKNPIDFKALALICPVANVKAAMGKGSRIKWFKKAVYKTGYEDDNYNLTSIQDIIDMAELPPSLIITTGNDHYYYQSVELDKLMTERNIKHTFLDVKDIDNKLDHCFNIMHPQYKESEGTNQALAEFFLRISR